MKRKILVLVLTLVLVFSLAACSSSSSPSGGSGSSSPAPSPEVTYPTKNITLIIPFGSGGTTDSIGRAFATVAQNHLKTTIIVENKTGASGAVGHAYARTVSKDGYTLIVTGNSPSTVVPNLEKVEYDPINDFEFIGLLANARNAIAVGKDSHFTTIKEMLDYAEKNPGKVTVATSGANGMDDFTIRFINAKLGTEITTVAFDSNGEAIAAVMGEHTTAFCGSVLSLNPTVGSGDMKLLSIVSEERDPKYPDVPTLKEQGIDVSINNLTGIATPAGAPAEVVAILKDALKEVTEDPAFKDMITKLGITVDYMDAEGFKSFVISESDKIKSILEAEKNL